MARLKVGHCSVDSGQLMITDPCYVKTFKSNDAEFKAELIGNYSYAGCASTSCQKGQSWGELDKGVGCVVGGFGGDGSFPVYVELDDDGIVVRIVVEFDTPNKDDN